MPAVGCEAMPGAGAVRRVLAASLASKFCVPELGMTQFEVLR